MEPGEATRILKAMAKIYQHEPDIYEALIMAIKKLEEKK